ncbi:MAG TPA: prepilin-type N-terminal cleavage/methylation domain-containing protein [Candidatus Paceibacterota bacterium]
MKFGFTLIELLVSIAVVVVVSILVTSGFNSFRESSQLNEAHSAIISILRDARSRTLSGNKNTQYGVHFETNQIVLFAGSSYSSGSSSNEPYATPSLAKVSVINLGGSSDAVFTRLTGFSSASGTIMVSSISNPQKTKTITIFSSGNIE